MSTTIIFFPRSSSWRTSLLVIHIFAAQSGLTVKVSPIPKCKQRKEHAIFMQRDLVAVQWTEKRQVNVISTQSDPLMTTVQCRAKGGVIDHNIPAPILSYNSGMFGVDLSDQYRSYNNNGRPGTKWWRYCVLPCAGLHHQCLSTDEMVQSFCETLASCWEPLLFQISSGGPTACRY